MMKQENKDVLALTLTVSACVFVFLVLSGCANIPLTHDQCNSALYQTAHEAENCLKAAEDYVQEQFALEERRVEKRDELIAYLNSCDKAKGFVLIETIKIGRSNLPNDRQKDRALREWGYKYTHANVSKRARLHQFQCATPQQIMDALRRLGY